MPAQGMARRQWLGAAGLLLSGCASGPATDAAGPATTAAPPIDTRHRARGQDSRVQFLILHFTNLDFARSLQVLTEREVSAHYLLSDEQPPRIYRLVPEDRRAWHAGLSSWKGQTQLNASSIGIEIVNAGDQPGPDGQPRFAPYPADQIDLLLRLVRDIVARHQIRPDRVLGHSDIAPQRKVDPGPLFPWHRLAEAGLVQWPEAARVAALLPAHQAQLPEVAWFQQRLATHGFQVPQHGQLDADTRRVLAAFQMKYRPALYAGQPDAETAALLQALVEPR